MATESVTELNRVQVTADEISSFRKHRVGPLETYDSPGDRLYWRLGQAFAQLVMINGDGLKSFQAMADNIQSDYLSAIEQLVSAAQIDAELAIADARSMK